MNQTSRRNSNQPSGQSDYIQHDCISPPTLQRHTPGEPGVWVLIFGDMIVFGIFFITFMVYRNETPELFWRSQQRMAVLLGLVNTFLLLTSSLFVVKSINLARLNNANSSARAIFVAICCGLCFLIIKYFEYSGKINSGITMTTNSYFMLYFVFTGLHALHVVLGIFALSALAFSIYESREITQKQLIFLESGAIFWHLVDVLWVVLFALFYVLR